MELPEFEPKTYDKLVKRVKGIEVGHLYGKDPRMLRVRKLPKNYKTWREYRDFLLATYPDENKKAIFEKGSRGISITTMWPVRNAVN